MGAIAAPGCEGCDPDDISYRSEIGYGKGMGLVGEWLLCLLEDREKWD